MYSKLGLLEGVLYKIKDSTILVANSFKKNDYVSGNFELVNFKYKEIENINIKKKGSVIKGILLGTLAGIFVGFTLGNLMGDDPPGLFSYSGTQKGLIFSSLLAIPGAVAGGLIGNIGISILIHGNIDSYKRNKNKMKKYALINR